MMVEIELISHHVFGNLGDYLSLTLSPWSINIIIKLLLGLCRNRNCNRRSCIEDIREYLKEYETPPIIELPVDIMEVIVQNLSLRDRIRMNSVCKSWRQLLLMSKDPMNMIHTPPEMPWLLLPKPGPKHKSKVISFHNMSGGGDSVINVKLPKSITRGGGWCCCGSTRGWLVMATESDSKNPKIFLFNPISGVTLGLPSLTPLPIFKQYMEAFLASKEVNVVLFFIERIEVSFGDEDNVVVAAVFNSAYDDGKDILAICKPNDKEWTIFPGALDCYQHLRYGDILFHNDSLYVNVYCVDVVESNFIAADFTISLTDSTKVKLELIPVISRGYSDKYLHFVIAEGSIVYAYFVESIHGELLQVIEHVDNIERENDDELYNKTAGFEIYKMRRHDNYKKKLTNLGDQAFFLAAGCSSSSVPARNSDTRFQGNCIYFAETSNTLFHELGVFYVEDGRIEHSIPVIELRMQSPTCWFAPKYKINQP